MYSPDTKYWFAILLILLAIYIYYMPEHKIIYKHGNGYGDEAEVYLKRIK
jgi:uncharacterized membrane protein YobD (UPF0266 family)